MKGLQLLVDRLGGMQQLLPQKTNAATIIENWTVDPMTKGLSSRVGYEKYRPDPATAWAPFSTLGRIDSLFVMQQTSGGARQSILFEADGALYLYYEVGQANALHKLMDRSPTTATAPASQYAQFGDRVIITNGMDAPVVVRPWPLAESSAITADNLASCIRQVGFYGKPPAPEGMRVATIDAAVGSPAQSAAFYTGTSTSNWYPVRAEAMSFPGAFGMGLHSGVTAGVTNSFRFKVAFIMDTGSISPLSDAVEVSWEITSGTLGVRYAPTLRIPLGPPGTVARRIYSTLNDGQDYYFVADVRNNIDMLFSVFRRDSTLSIAAPVNTESGLFPAPRARYCAVFKECAFFDGGLNDGNVLYYSSPGRLDQFGVNNYINLASGGGNVTGLYSYYNNLIILRENAIDVLTGTFPDFTVQTVTRQVVCRSAATLDAVPSIGVVFLAQDGVYALTGGLDGGSVLQVVNIGAPVQRELERLTQSCSARAVARYAPKERAYHLYFPADGNDRPQLGLVYHLDKQGWSMRTGFPVGVIDRTFEGALIFGHNTGAEAGADSEAGLFVISSIRSMGGSIVGDAYVLSNAPTSIYESAWQNFGDAQVKKQVQYVTLWVMTTGTVTLTINHYKDFEYTKTGTNAAYVAQPPDQEKQPVYDTAVVGTDEWQSTRLVPIRVPVAQQSCSWFKFQVTTTDDLVLVGYEIEYKVRGTQVVAGRLS